MDNHTQEQRHKNMKAIKNKGTKIEKLLQQELWKRKLYYRKNTKKIFGKPDIAFIGKKIAVFCDSEYFHGYNWEERKNDIKTNQDFWIQKIERNMERDKEVNEKLAADGWLVLRFWGTDIKKNTVHCADIIEEAFKERSKDCKKNKAAL